MRRTAETTQRGLFQFRKPHQLSIERPQLENNLDAAKVTLSPDQVARLDEAIAIAPGFPFRMLNNPETQQGFTGGKLEQFDAPAEPVA
jgi:hypothetical protein